MIIFEKKKPNNYVNINHWKNNPKPFGKISRNFNSD